MRNLILTFALLFSFTLSAQQTSDNTLSFGAGVFEQSGIIGNALGLQAEFTHQFSRNFGLTADYSYAKLQKGDGREVNYLGSVVKTPDGSTFNQLSLLFNYKFYTDEDMAIRVGAGAAHQNFEEFYPSAQLDIIAFADAKVYPYLSWQPVFRGGFGEGDGWSHTVTLNLAIKL